MNKGFSTYLDLVRVTAALLVLTGHLSAKIFGSFYVPGQIGHNAVIIFFLLSGYVIAFVANTREHSLGAFAVSRAARIYSVAVPALLLTLAVDLFLLKEAPTSPITARMPVYEIMQPVKYLAFSLSFGGDLWFLNIPAFSDVPYWSLLYEVLYYAVFAAAFYFDGRRRIVLVAILLAIMGPKLWVLFPIWILGTAIYRLHSDGRMKIGVWEARAILLVSGILLVSCFAFNLTLPIDDNINRLSSGWTYKHLAASKWFVGDTVLGLILAVNFFAAHYAELRFGFTGPIVKWVAALTFAIYLMHYPLMEFWETFTGKSVIALALLVLASIVPLGLFTERAKLWLRRFFEISLRMAYKPAA
jgi:peptidoglycan/LPS O-acetylase OafA/YrhL